MARDGRIFAALDPLREALLRAAREEAEQVRARADAAAQHQLREAQAQAERIRAEARARGTADCAELIAAQRSRSGRQARSIVLGAELEEFRELHAAAREAVARLCAEPEYPLMRRRMAALVREALGGDAEVRDAPGGGVVGTAPGRLADLSLARLADRAVDGVLAATSERAATVEPDGADSAVDDSAVDESTVDESTVDDSAGAVP